MFSASTSKMLVRSMHRTAKVSFAILAVAVLGCACDRAWRLAVTVIIPPNVQASYADSLPAGVFISGQKLDDENESAIGSRFAPRTIGLICEPSMIPLSFHTTVDEAGYGVETRVHAWLQSQAGLRDFLEGGTNNVSTTGTTNVNADRSNLLTRTRSIPQLHHRQLRLWLKASLFQASIPGTATDN
jgi:hypothetical protein